MKRFIALIFGAGLLAFAPSAHAMAVTWTLDGVTFVDGGTATGSFNYDADSDTISAVNITTTGGSFAGWNYTSPDPDESPTDTLVQFKFTDVFTHTLTLQLGTPMTNVPGIFIPLLFTSEEIIPDMGRAINAGSIVSSSVVPIPAALPLFASALLIFGFVARKRRSAAAA